MDENPYQSPETESLPSAPSRLARLPFGTAALVSLCFTLLVYLLGGSLNWVASLTLLLAISWLWQRLTERLS
jgi:hypothetical protein